MKTCNNCNTVNEAVVDKCVHCHMPGNFTLHAVKDEVVTVEEKTNIQCGNCGSYKPGEGTHCTDCNFPLPHAQKSTISTLSSVQQHNKKVG